MWCAVSGPLTEGTHEYEFVEFLVKVLENPAVAKVFFADQCASAAVSGSLATLYAGLQRFTPGAASVNACRDKGNGAEDLLACAPPHCPTTAALHCSCASDYLSISLPFSPLGSIVCRCGT